MLSGTSSLGKGLNGLADGFSSTSLSDLVLKTSSLDKSANRLIAAEKEESPFSNFLFCPSTSFNFSRNICFRKFSSRAFANDLL